MLGLGLGLKKLEEFLLQFKIEKSILGCFHKSYFKFEKLEGFSLFAEHEVDNLEKIMNEIRSELNF